MVKISPPRLGSAIALLALAACSSNSDGSPADGTGGSAGFGNPGVAASSGSGSAGNAVSSSGGASNSATGGGATPNGAGNSGPAGSAGNGGPGGTFSGGTGATTGGTASTGGTGASISGSGGTGTSNGGTSNGGTSPGTGGSSGTAGTTSSGGSTGANNAQHVDNPFDGAKGYVNPEWQAKANAEQGGSRVANTPTAVWLDRIAAIQGTTMSMSNGSMGLADHLDAALKQGAGYIQFVIYDLPGRDCAALASNGELSATDLPKYKSDYIDPIATIEGDPKYQTLRIVNIIEPDSLPNLVTNTDVTQCATMKSNGGYVQGVAYALQKLGAIPNVYNYLDAGHHGWLGWDSNLGPCADLFAQVATMAGMNTVTGFITNTANYSALTEPFFTADTMVNGQSVKNSKWVNYNNYVDETSYAAGLKQKLVAAGFGSKIGMLIDTSRNGWGGPMRPTAASTSTDVDTFVDASRVDRRIHAGNWCNQSGAGLGERPRANPTADIQAYVWIKPPGESDGSSMAIQNDDGKGFDQMCDPTYMGNERNGNNLTGALANAPISGAWFSAQFQQLMTNAYPPL